MLNFCTLFDSNYLSRGLAMYESLREHCNDFHLYIFPFDDKCLEILLKLDLPSVTVVPLEKFEDEKLLAVKPSRTAVEYCWTCTPSIILYSMNKFALSNCTYIDADLYFYSDPSVLFGEFKDGSVIITKHRYTPYYDLSKLSGIYCVQFVAFKNDPKGMKVLNWWRDACLDWCYARTEEGKFGDQKYLDDWPERFEGVRDLENLGGGTAPWNVQQYNIYSRNEKILGNEKKSGNEFGLVFYHFHSVRFFTDGSVLFGSHAISRNVKRILYMPYIKSLEDAKVRVAAIDASFDPHGAGPRNWKIHIYNLKNALTKNSEFIKNFYDLYNGYSNTYRLSSIVNNS